MKTRSFFIFMITALLASFCLMPVLADEVFDTDTVLADNRNIEIPDEADISIIDETEMPIEDDADDDLVNDPVCGLIEEVLVSESNLFVENEADYCTVTFYSSGGTEVEQQHIRKGDKAIEPEPPSKDFEAGGSFLGWYDESLTRRFFFTDPVWEDKSLYAKWNPCFFLFSYNDFDDNETDGGLMYIMWHRPGSAGEESYEIVDYGAAQYSGLSSTVYYLKAAPKVGYLFSGWYKGKCIWPEGTDHPVTMEPLEINDTRVLLYSEPECSITLTDDGVCVCAVFEPCTEHTYEKQFTKATPEKDGRWVDVCSKCRYADKIHTIPMPKTYKLSASSFTWDGKAKKPSVTITDAAGKVIPADHYSVAYLNNTMPGTAKVRVTFLSDRYEGTKDIPFTILKAPGTMTAKGKTVKLKAAKIAKKKQTIKAAKAITVSGAKGKVTYKKVKGNKKIKVASGGKITVKKGLKKGTYKVRICVTDAGSASVAAKEQVVTVRIKVK